MQPEPADRPNFDSFVRNFRQPGSVAWKVSRWTTNTLIRLRRRSDCCGNSGEPGC
jgi:hypothetical protein